MSSINNPLGRVVPNPRGAYDAGVAYMPPDIVIHGTDSFMAKKPVTGISPPDPEHWQRMTEVGAALDDAVDHANDAAIIADLAKASAQQALANLLAKIGTAVAPLVGGVVPITNLPAVALTQVYVRDSDAGMAALDVQEGDICIRSDESKTYVCGPDHAWHRMQSPTNYADLAGYAPLAGSAENANKINNVGMAAMTDREYETAVHDPETFYLTWPEEV